METTNQKIVDFYQKQQDTDYEIATDACGALTQEQLKAYHIRVLTGSEAPSVNKDLLFVSSDGNTVHTNAARKLLCTFVSADAPARDYLLLKLSRLRAAGATLEEAAAYLERHKADAAPVSAPKILMPLWSPEHIQPFDQRNRA